MQADQCTRCFDRIGYVAKIFAGQFIKAEIIRWAAFPQKFHIYVCCDIFRLRHKFNQPRLGEA